MRRFVPDLFLANSIKTILEAAGASLKDLIDCTVFLVNMEDYGAMNQVYNEYFNADTGTT